MQFYLFAQPQRPQLRLCGGIRAERNTAEYPCLSDEQITERNSYLKALVAFIFAPLRLCEKFLSLIFVLSVELGDYSVFFPQSRKGAKAQS